MKEVDHVGRFCKYAGMMVPKMAVCLAWVWQPDLIRLVKFLVAAVLQHCTAVRTFALYSRHLAG